MLHVGMRIRIPFKQSEPQRVVPLEVAYVQPAAQVEPHGAVMEVRAPFVIRYRDLAGRTGVARGTAVWQVARRDGAPRIVGLTRALAPGSVLPGELPVAKP